MCVCLRFKSMIYILNKKKHPVNSMISDLHEKIKSLGNKMATMRRSLTSCRTFVFRASGLNQNSV